MSVAVNKKCSEIFEDFVYLIEQQREHEAREQAAMDAAYLPSEVTETEGED